MTSTLVFLHGLESGPHGSKYQALREVFPDLLAPDCTGLHDIEARLRVIENTLAGVEKMVLVGSSFGGLAALMFAQDARNRSRITGCLLCAPALPLATPGSLAWIPPQTVVLHGTRDDVVPYQASADFCAAHGVRLVTVDDDHGLSNSRALVVELARGLLEGADGLHG